MSYPNSQMELCLVWKKELPSHPCLKWKLSCGKFWKPLILQTVLPCRQMQNHFTRSLNTIAILSRKSTVETQRTGIPKGLFSTTKKGGHKLWWQTCPQKTKSIYQFFNCLLSGVSSFEMLSLQTSKWPWSKNSRMQWSAFMFKFAKRIVWKKKWKVHLKKLLT